MKRDCPRCGGDGAVGGSVHTDPNGTMRVSRETCGECGGDGEIETPDRNTRRYT